MGNTNTAKTTLRYDKDSDSFSIASRIGGIQEVEDIPRQSLFGCVESRIKGAIESTRAVVQKQFARDLEVKQLLERFSGLVEVETN